MKDNSSSLSLRVTAMQDVIRKLREEDLLQGHCFMIFDDSLTEGHAYYEYPNGQINIEQIDGMNLDAARTIIRVLSDDETEIVKLKHGVFQ